MSDKSISVARRNWILPLFLGIALPAAIWGIYQLVNPPIDAVTNHAAHIMGYNPRTYNTVMNLTGKAERQGDLSNQDWQTLMAIFHDPNENIHQEAITVMMLLKHSPRRNQILTMVRPLLTSHNEGIEVRSLTLLWRFNDPIWREEALKRKGRTDERMRLTVEDILSKGDVK